MKMKTIIAGVAADRSLLSVVVAVAEASRVGLFYDLHLVHCQCLLNHIIIVMRKMTSLTSVTTPGHDLKHVHALMLEWILVHNLELELIHEPVENPECVLALGSVLVTSLLSVVSLGYEVNLVLVSEKSPGFVVNLALVFGKSPGFVVNLGPDQDNQRSVEGLCCVFLT